MGNRIERNALITGAIGGLVMAVAGWVAYYLSGSEALLLDGNFSFIGALATLLALLISTIKTRTTRTYPFGQYAYEPAFSLFIGLLAGGVILAAIASNATKIVNYSQGARFPVIDTSVILVYTIVMVALCFGLALLFRNSNRRLRGNSTILGAYTVQSALDGLLSAGAGAALLLFGLAAPEGDLGFLTQIGDAIIVVLLCLLVLYQPVKLVRDSFRELSGGALKDPAVAARIRSVVSEHIEAGEMADLFITKTGSAYLVVAFMGAGFFGANDPRRLLEVKREVTRRLEDELGHVSFELTLSEDVSPSGAG